MCRWLRVLVCLLLVSCILVNLSTLKAEAVSATAVSLAVGIPVAVAFGLNALGVRQGSSPSAFNQVVSDAVDVLSPEWAVNGLTTMLALTTDGLTKTFASMNFLQSLLDFLYDSKIVSSSAEIPDALLACPNCISFFNRVNSQHGKVYWYFGDSYARGYRLIDSNASLYLYVNGAVTLLMSDSSSDNRIEPYYLNFTDDSIQVGSFVTSLSGSADFFNCLTLWGSSIDTSVSTAEDLTLESVGHDIETDYETYVETGIVGVDFGVQFEDDPNTDRNEEDDGNDLWLPVGIPGQLSGGSYIDQTQQDAQFGNTPQDVLDELLQNSGSGDGSGDGTGSDSGSGNGSGNTWKPPSDHNKFALADLSKFFPFCIPFDLYDFFTLLNAEPVAPVLSWEIKDLAGQTYSLDVDLSQWDSVALLFRRLQLFLFITGLAAASRKFIKW